MESSLKSVPPQSGQEDDWDTDGFVIPNLIEKESDAEKRQVHEDATDFSPSKPNKEDSIYLGPHGGRSSQGRMEQEQSLPSSRRRLKNKLKEADIRFAGEGRENKVDALRELVGGSKIAPAVVARPDVAQRDWLDPHCHESLFHKPQG